MQIHTPVTPKQFFFVTLYNNRGTESSMVVHATDSLTAVQIVCKQFYEEDIVIEIRPMTEAESLKFFCVSDGSTLLLLNQNGFVNAIPKKVEHLSSQGMRKIDSWEIIRFGN